MEDVEIAAEMLAKDNFLLRATIGAGVVGCLVGVAGGYLIARKRLEAKYAELSRQEIAEARDHYAKRNKAEPYDTPAGALEAVSERGRIAADAVLDYQGNGKDEEKSEAVVVVEQETTIERHNIFTDQASSPEWDSDQEQSKRDAHPDEPYILTQEEYMENEPDYQQSTLTYFAEDDVLCDEKDQPIPDVDGVVGEDNLSRFGHGSRDNRVLYIRNDRIQLAFEVIKNDGSYAQEVAGFIQHEDRPRILRMRGERY